MHPRSTPPRWKTRGGGPGADCAAPPSHIPDMLGRRAAPPGSPRRGLCAVGWIIGAPRRPRCDAGLSPRAATTLIDCFRVIADALRLLPVIAAAAPVIPLPLFVQLVQLDPLLRREHLPDMQELKRAHFVQVTSDRFHAIDLLDDLLFVRVGSNEP